MKHQAVLDQISALASDVPLHLIQPLAAAIEKMNFDNWSYTRSRLIQSIAQPHLRIQIGQLLDTWRQSAQDLTPQALSMALLSAAQTAEQLRQSTITSLVWTGPDSRGPALRRTDQALLQVISTAERQLLVVSFAVYKIATIRQALVQAAGRGVQIRICVEAPDPSEGKIAYDTIQALGKNLAQNATVYIWPKEKRPHDAEGRYGSLHVKCAVADQKLLFISSANLTEYALTLNMELGILIEGGPLAGQVVSHFDRLIGEGVLMDERNHSSQSKRI